MAADILRSLDDDIDDALCALDAAERELANWRAHLLRVRAELEPAGVTMQARRSARVTAGTIATAVAHTIAAAHRATDEPPMTQLSSVS